MDLTQAIWVGFPFVVIAVLFWLARRRAERGWHTDAEFRRFPKNDVDRLLDRLNAQRSS